MSTTTAFLIVQAVRKSHGRSDLDTGLRPIDSIRVVASRQNRPSRLERDQIAVKIQLEIPDSAFGPVTPSAVVRIPESYVSRADVEVEGLDATEEGAS